MLPPQSSGHFSGRAQASSDRCNVKEQAAALYRESNFDAAKRLLDPFLQAHPDDAEALFLRAGISTKCGNWLLAAEDLERVLEAEPDNFESLVLLGLVLKNEGRFNEAIDKLLSALKINPSDSSCHNTLGMCYLHMREIDKAIEGFHRALKWEPGSGAIYQNLGLALRLNEKRYQALSAFRKAAELAPENASNFLSLAQQLRRMGLKSECVDALEDGRKHHPDDLGVLLALAQAYAEFNRSADAERLFQQCLDRNPSAVQPYAIWLQKEGRFDESIDSLRQSIQSHPYQGLAYLSLAEAKEFALQDGSPWSDRIPGLLDEPRLSRPSKMYLWYALARAKENDGDYEGAMRAFDSANELAFALYNQGRPFDFEIGKKITDRTKALYSAAELGRILGRGSTSKKPILIVGMIRSGTTLLDQILSCHPSVRSAGESEFWMEESDHLYARWRDRVHPQDLSKLAERYLNALHEMAGDAARITDKMPLNYQHLGHIHAVLPNAKILHIRRHPIDTCLSIYATHFGSGPHFAYNKQNIAFYYQEYARLMEHWRSVLPGDRFFELDYEDLVSDEEKVVKDVLAFCDLPWDASCLHPEESALRISTPSRWQARQPIFRTSVEKWKRYEPWLADFGALKGLAHPPAAQKTEPKPDAASPKALRQRAEGIKPRFQRAPRTEPAELVNYGAWLQQRGRFEEAEACLKSAIEMDRNQGSAYLALAEASLLSADDVALIGHLVKLADDNGSNQLNRIHLSYALGKAFDRARRYEEAATYFRQANDLAFQQHNGGRNFNRQIAKGYPGKIAQVYSKEAIEKLRPIGSVSEMPILIVGMIRSGTTLLDQIVSAHSQVSAAGELPFWKVAGDKFNRVWYDTGIDAGVWKGIQDEYLATLSRVASKGTRVTDKMPLNFELLGMIHVAFPRAKILHIRRNPADTCLSIFQNYYGPGPNFAYDWENMLTYYECYLSFMEAWRAVLPKQLLLEIDYEQLVTDSEQAIRSVIRFLDLPWEDTCLHPETNRGPVETPSRWQVRQPLYRSSIEKWRDYAPWVPQLQAANDIESNPKTTLTP